MDHHLLAQLQHLLRPLSTRISNLAARAVIQLVNDGSKLQQLQLGVLAGEDVDDAEHHQPYGFSSVPLVGAEAVVIFPSGDRGHPLVVSVSDRRYRPTGGEPGEVTVYNHTGARITLTKDGDIEVQPADGRQVFVRTEDGTAQRLLTEQDALILRQALSTATIAVGAGGAAGVVAAMDLAVQALDPDAEPAPTWPLLTETLLGE
jgi:phage baseplate assembly protein V